MPDSGDYVGARPYLERAFTAGRASGRDRNTAAGFLDEYGNAELANETLEGGESAAKLRGSFRLERLLERIEMDHEGLGFERIDDTTNRRDACRDHLADAEVGDEERPRSGLSEQGRLFRKGSSFELASLRTDPQCPAALFAGDREIAIEGGRIGMAHGHSGDEKWRVERAVEAALGDADVGEVEFGQGLVAQADLLQPGHALRLIAGIEGLVDMLPLAKLELLHVHAAHYTSRKPLIP